jgi:hypothetical protein
MEGQQERGGSQSSQSRQASQRIQLSNVLLSSMSTSERTFSTDCGGEIIGMQRYISPGLYL